MKETRLLMGMPVTVEVVDAAVTQDILDEIFAYPETVSLTAIGPDVYDADRFATAAFAMGRDKIIFIENLDTFEGYMIDQNGQVTLTSGFEGHACDD